MRNFTFNDSFLSRMRKKRWLDCLSFVLMFFLGQFVYAQEYQHLQIASGLTQDVIANGVGAANLSTTSGVDVVNFAFVSNDYQATVSSPALTFGLPVNGLITSAVTATPNLTFQLASYAANNSMKLEALNSTATLTFSNAVAAKKLLFLVTSGSGNSTFTGVITFADNTTQSISSSTVPDWFNSTTLPVAISGIGRINTTNNTTENPAGNPRMYQLEVPILVANQTKIISSIQITKTSLAGNALNIFAVTAELLGACPSPDALSASVSTTSATVSWTIPAIVPSGGYQYYFSTTNTPPTSSTTPSGTLLSSATSVALTSLTPTQNYFFWIRSDCGNNTYGSWQFVSFTTATPGHIGGNSTATNTNFPINTCFGFNYSQQIYLASELQAVLEPGNTYITEIRFKSNTLPTTPANFTSWTVYMGNTSQASFSSATNWIPNLTPVFTGNLTFTANGWVSIVLNTGFVWDGTSNLVIGVDENTPGFSCTANWAAFPSGSNRGILYYSDATNPDPASPPTANVAPNANIAQIQIQSTTLPNCLPPTSVVISNITFQSANVDWTPIGTEAEWQYVVGPSSATSPDALTPITVTVSEASISSGLNPATSYKVWIRANCGTEYSPWTGPYLFKTLCSTFTNYTENFEGYSTGTTSPMPDCWSKGGAGSTYITTGSVAPMSPVNRLYMFASGSANPPTEAIAVLPSVSNLQANSHRLKFKAYATAANRTLDIGYLTVPTDVNSFVFLQQILLPSTTATTATEFIIIPGALPAGIEKLAIRNSGIPTGSTTAYLDDVVWEAIPTCAEPSALSVSGITNTTAVLGWTEAATATAWEIQYGAPGFAIGTGTIVAANSNPFTLTALTPNTNYVYYVRAVCSSTDSSYWTGPFAFKTQCDDVTSYSESFDTFPSGVNSLPDCWSRGLIGTPSVYITTGSALPMSPANRLYMFVSSTTTPPSEAYAILPAVSNLNAGTHRLRFKAFATQVDRFLELGYLTDPTNLSTFVYLTDFQVPGTAVASTQQFIYVPIAANIPSGVKHLAIKNPGFPGASSTIYIDDVTWEQIPTCVEPSGVSVASVLATSATLNWTAASPAPAAGYEYYVSTASTNPDGTTVPTGSVGAGITTAALTALTPTTQYFVWVRSVCSTTDKSAWTTIVTFTTPCASFTPAYIEPFTTWLPAPVGAPACWSKYGTGDLLTGPTGPTNSGSWGNDGYLNVGFTGAARINIFTTTVRGWLVSPVFDLTAGGYQVKYKVGATQYAATGPISSGPTPTLGTDDFVYVLMSTDGGATWTNLTTYNAANTPSHLGTTATFNIPTVTSNAVKFAFYGTSGTVTEGQDLDFFIDDFEVQTIPVAAPVCSATVTAVPNASCGNEATAISWSAVAGADGYKLTIGTTAGGSEILNGLVVGGLTYSYVGSLNTTYYYKVVPFNANGDATGCVEQSFTTAATGCYCPSVPTSLDGTGITSIVVGTTNFTNTNVTYTNNAATPVTLMQNVSSPIVINFATGYTYNTYIWIDSNDNFIFDASELLYTGESAQPNPSTLNASITIPTTTALGAHRMRIVTADALPTPNPCYSGSWGVTVDFTVNVIQEDLSVGGFDDASFKYYPNPVTDILTVSYSNAISDVVVYNLLGQQVVTVKPNATQTQVDLSGLTAGTYMVKVTSDEVTKTVKVVKN